MKNWIITLGFILISMGLSSAGRAEHTRVTYPGALSVEGLGRGGLYAIQYDQVFSDELAAGIGIGSVGLKNNLGVDTNTSVTVVPLYVNYYFQRDAGSFFATGGASLLMGDQLESLNTKVGNIELPDSSILPTVGLGFETRTDNRLLLRITGYLLVADQLAPWGGLTLGYTF